MLFSPGFLASAAELWILFGAVVDGFVVAHYALSPAGELWPDVLGDH